MADDYVTLFDVYVCAINPDQLADVIARVGAANAGTTQILVAAESFHQLDESSRHARSSMSPTAATWSSRSHPPCVRVGAGGRRLSDAGGARTRRRCGGNNSRPFSAGT